MGKLKGAADGVPFKKGDARINRKGRPPKLPELETMMAEVLSDKDAMRAILIALVKKAKGGDVRASELIMDRAYGKLKTMAAVDMSFDQLSEEQIDVIIDKLFKQQNNG